MSDNMENRMYRIAGIVVVAVTLAGCSDPDPSNSAESSSNGQKRRTEKVSAAETSVVEQRGLDIDTLVTILDMKSWTFRFRGGPVKCWLEIDEVGQETMGDRIPKYDALVSSDAEGKIIVSIRPLRDGGELLLMCGDRTSRHQMTKNEFIYHWNGSQTSHTALNADRVIELAAGKEYELASFTAREAVFEIEEKPRKVTLTLKVTLDVPEE